MPKKMQALLHASVDCRRKLVVDWVASTDLEDSTKIEVRQCFSFSVCLIWAVSFSYVILSNFSRHLMLTNQHGLY
jgi:hypothetical protein